MKLNYTWTCSIVTVALAALFVVASNYIYRKDAIAMASTAWASRSLDNGKAWSHWIDVQSNEFRYLMVNYCGVLTWYNPSCVYKNATILVEGDFQDFYQLHSEQSGQLIKAVIAKSLYDPITKETLDFQIK